MSRGCSLVPAMLLNHAKNLYKILCLIFYSAFPVLCFLFHDAIIYHMCVKKMRVRLTSSLFSKSANLLCLEYDK